VRQISRRRSPAQFPADPAARDEIAAAPLNRQGFSPDCGVSISMA
jgi:hypothetical protein